jgi:cyclase
MLKIRLIALLLIREGICVQSIGFRRYLPVGRPEIAVEFLDSWGIDEIICLNIDKAGGKADYFREIERYATRCQVPLAIGGGIASVDDAAHIISNGADKVVINSALINAPDTVEKAARRYGSQSIIASIDCRRDGTGYRVWVNGGRTQTGFTPSEMARRAQDLGAGELMITSIDRDGSKSGYDLALLQEISATSNIPVIIAGGAAKPAHLEEAILAGAEALAVGNSFHFVEHAPALAKQYLADRGHNMRMDSPFRYDDSNTDEFGRILKKDEETLSRLRFIKIEKIVI